jgi:myo-inositol-1-phosphate synthase
MVELASDGRTDAIRWRVRNGRSKTFIRYFEANGEATGVDGMRVASRNTPSAQRSIMHIPAHSEGKLAVLLPGMGAVATTFIAGVLLARRGLGTPVGSLTQLGTIRENGRTEKISSFAPLTPLDRIEFAGWDLFPDSAYDAAVHAGVLGDKHLALVRDELAAIRPMTAAFYPDWVRRLSGTHVKRARSKAEMVEALRDDIRRTVRDKGCERAVAVWCGSTEVYQVPSAVHQSASAFEAGLLRSAPEISNSQLYAWACLREGVPFVNGSPNLAVDFPGAVELAREHEVAVAGKDFKTGQTLLKTIVAPGLRARQLGLRGWYSTNILGNRDGEVLDDPDAFKTKEASKLGVLDSILEPSENPDLYGQMVHKVRIDYYPPRGDAKEGWDNIDIFGWLGYPMAIKINFLCRDSILAAPLVLDLALLIDLAQRSGKAAIQDWLGFYFKAPMAQPGESAVHDLFLQMRTLKNELRRIRGHAAIETPSSPTLSDFEEEFEQAAAPAA